MVFPLQHSQEPRSVGSYTGQCATGSTALGMWS